MKWQVPMQRFLIMDLYTESHTINYIEVVQTGERYEIDKEIQNNAKQSDYSKASAYHGKTSDA